MEVSSKGSVGFQWLCVTGVAYLQEMWPQQLTLVPRIPSLCYATTKKHSNAPGQQNTQVQLGAAGSVQ